ncbi:PGC [Symbiodinium microadriaticum]|nr:PGC [Symbiodinium microadriaticum]
MALAFKLHYRRTFIDMDEEPWHSLRARAASCPPSMPEGEETTEEQEESKSHELYLEQVVREASKFHVRRSRGSMGHPEVCRRPCVFLAAGSCSQGEGCGYCHCAHNEPRARPDKKQRAALQGLQQDDLFAVVLPHLQVRAELPQLRGKATQLLRIVEGISVTTSPCVSPSASSSSSSSGTLADGKLKSLNKTLERMTFSGLVALLCESIAKGNTRDQLLQALEDLRAQCAIPP